LSLFELECQAINNNNNFCSVLVLGFPFDFTLSKKMGSNGAELKGL